MVSFAIEEPTTAAATWCLSQYFAELDARFESGFDPALSIPADARELTPPAGVLDAFSSEPYADHWFQKRLGSIRSVR